MLEFADSDELNLKKDLIMKNLITNSESSILPDSARTDVDKSTNEQLDGMLAEFWTKAHSMHELFSSLDSRISAIFDESKTGINPRTIHSQPVITFDDMVHEFKMRKFERLHMGYIIPLLEQGVNY